MANRAGTTIRALLPSIALFGAVALAVGCTSGAIHPDPLRTIGEGTGDGAVGAVGGAGPAGPDATDSGGDGGSPAQPEANKPDRRAAEALVREFIDAENLAMTTGDADPLRALSASGCVSCEAIADVAAKVNGDGRSLEPGYRRSVARLNILPGTDPPIVQVTVDHTEQIRLGPDGRVVERFDAGRVLTEYRTTKEEGRWSVAEITAHRR